MPDAWNDLSWEEQRLRERGDLPRKRNTDSSVSAQYEDFTPPDNAWEHEQES